MLLTSSQVSAAITSGIIALFTSILFASGYYLQQQSVHNLNAVLHPGGGRKGPWEQLVARAELALESQDAVNFRDGGDGTDGSIEGILAGISGDGDDDGEEVRRKAVWEKRAYVSIVRRPEDVCNAIMAVTSLSIQGSPARRVLVYPNAWVDGGSGEFKRAPETELIQIAKQEHLLETLAWGAVSSQEMPQMYSSQTVGDFLLGLRDFQTLLFLQPDGMILNASRLDTLFDVEMDAAVTGINRGKETLAPAILIKPGAAVFDYSEVSLRAEEIVDNGLDTRISSFPSTVETTRSLERSQDDFRTRYNGEENELMKTGYVMLSSMSALEVEEETALNNEAQQYDTSELRKRGGGATLPRSLSKSSLADDFSNEYEKHKEMVCGAMLSIIKQDDADDWAYE